MVSNVQLAADLQETRNGWQSFVLQQLEWLTSTADEVTLVNPITSAEITVETFFKIVTDYEGVIDPATGAAAAAQDWANYPVDSLVPQGDLEDDYSALHHATKASQSAAAAAASVASIGSSVSDAASSAADAASAETVAVGARNAAQAAQAIAETARDEAETAQGGAEAAETGAVTAAGEAEAAQALAETAQGAAESARDTAYDWANEDEDVAVSGGEYSAYHWALKAQAAAGVDLSGYAAKVGGNTFSGAQVFADTVTFEAAPFLSDTALVVESTDDGDQHVIQTRDSGGNIVGVISLKGMDGTGTDAEWEFGSMGLVDFQNTGHVLFQNSGNVGIGIGVPLYDLDVGGRIRAASDVYVGGETAADRVRIHSNLINGYIDFSGKLFLRPEGSTADAVIVSDTGDLQLNNNLDVEGVSTLTGDLSVGGTVSFTGALDAAGGVDVTGNVDVTGAVEVGTTKVTRLAASGVEWEDRKHSITVNDGYGNFNINVGQNPIGTAGDNTCTETGYVSQFVFTQSTGLWEFKVSDESLAVGNAPTYTVPLSFTSSWVRMESLAGSGTRPVSVNALGQLVDTAPSISKWALAAEGYNSTPEKVSLAASADISIGAADIARAGAGNELVFQRDGVYRITVNIASGASSGSPTASYADLSSNLNGTLLFSRIDTSGNICHNYSYVGEFADNERLSVLFSLNATSAAGYTNGSITVERLS